MANIPIIIELDEQALSSYQHDEDLDHGLCEICSAQLTDDDESNTICNVCAEVLS